MERTADVATTAQVVLAVLGVLAALHFMKVILVPIALALLLACLLSPFVSVLRRILPLSATGASVLLFVFLVVAGLVLAFATIDNLEQAADTLPGYAERVAGTLSRQVSALAHDKPYLRGLLPDPGTIDALGDQNRSLIVKVLRERAGEVWGWIGGGLMILILVLFLLAESEMLTRRMIRFFAPSPGDARAAERTFRAVVLKVRSYLVTYTLLNLGLGIAVAAALSLLGVEFAVALGALTAVASFIPYIGQVVSGVVVVAVALSHSGSLGDALIVASVYVGLVGLAGYVAMPIVMGRSLDLNGTTVLISCLFWWFLWGLVGLFLAIPITVTLKLVFQYVPRLHRWAELMSRDWQTPTPVEPTAHAAEHDAPAPVEHPAKGAAARSA